MKQRKTRFNTGGANNPYQGEDIDPFSAMRDEEGNIKKGEIPEAEPRQSVGRMEGLPAKAQTFKEAFAAARSAGDKTFEWQGKRYTTELATPKKPSSAPEAASYSNEGRSRPAPVAPSKPKSIYDLSRDPLIKKIKESMKERGMKSGGSASSRGDGIAQRGKTRGKMV